MSPRLWRANVILNVGHDTVETPSFLMQEGRRKINRPDGSAVMLNDPIAFRTGSTPFTGRGNPNTARGRLPAP